MSKVVADLTKLAATTSSLADAAGEAEVTTAVSDLSALAASAPSDDLAHDAVAIRDALSGLADLARADPQGADSTTRDKAQVLQKQYLSATRSLTGHADQTCPAGK